MNNPALDDQRLRTVIAERFRLEGVIGFGGFSTVYRALDLLLERVVAVKILNNPSASGLERFRRECKALAAIESELLPEIHAWGQDSSGSLYIAMELLEGESLAEYLSECSLTDENFVEVFVQVADALSVVHSLGLIHRDVKPENIMLDLSSAKIKVKLLDLGSAHLMQDDATLTATAGILGSLNYLSPEHFNPKSLDERSDIFSLGCVMYRCFTGKPPYDAIAPMALLSAMNTESRAALPDGVAVGIVACIEKCLQPNPENRFQSAAQLRNSILSADLAPRARSRLHSANRTTKFAVVSLLLVVLFAGALTAVVKLKTGRKAEDVARPLAVARRPSDCVRDLIRCGRAQGNQTILAKQREILDAIGLMADRQKFWDTGRTGVDLAQELNLCGCDQLDAGNVQAAQQAFDFCDKCRTSRFDKLEFAYDRYFHHRSHKCDEALLREVHLWVEKAAKLGCIYWQGRLLSLEGMINHDLGRDKVAVDCFEESFQLLTRDGTEVPAVLGSIEIREVQCLDALGDPATVEKRISLLRDACNLFNEQAKDLPIFANGPAAAMCASLLKLPPQKRDKALDRLVVNLIRRAATVTSLAKQNRELVRLANDLEAYSKK